jgi:ribose transport system permease protein
VLREAGLIVAILAIGLLFTFANPTFGSLTNLSNVASQVSFIGVIAVSSTFVLITGEIDLSVGSIVAVCSVVLGELLQGHVEIWVALVLTLLAGAAMGAFNGLLSLSIGVPTIIITLGTLTAYQGVADQISNGYPLQNFSTSTPFFTILQSKLWGVIPYDTLVFLAFAVLSAIVLRRTTVGLRVYAMGSNRWSAELAGIRLSRIQVGVLTFSGAAAALSAILGVGFTGTGDPNSGTNYALYAIAAVIIGGAKITGGAGTVLGSVLGILLLQVIQDGLVIIGVPIYVLLIVSGSVVVIAVGINALVTRRTNRARAYL